MPRVILHIGTHKTATTTIQRTLYEARKALTKRGVLYPDYGLIGKPPRPSHAAAANGLMHGGELSQEEARHFFRRVVEASRDHEVTIISAEPMYRHVAGSRPGERDFFDRPAYWNRRAAYIAMIRELLAEAPVEVVVVFRRQPDYAQSLYREHVKRTGFTLPFRDFLETFWYHFDYLRQSRAWAAEFATVRAMRFEDLIRDGAVPRHFGELIGVDLADLPAPSLRNVGNGVDATILKRQLNALRDNAVRQEVRAFMDGLPQEERAALQRRSFFDGPAHVEQFRRQFEQDNAALRSEFFPALPADPLFSEKDDSNVAFGDEMTPRFLRLLLAEGRPWWSGLPGRIRHAAGRLSRTGGAPAAKPRHAAAKAPRPAIPVTETPAPPAPAAAFGSVPASEPAAPGPRRRDAPEPRMPEGIAKLDGKTAATAGRRCPLCGGTSFGPYRNRPFARCSTCGAKERERLMALALDCSAVNPGGRPIYHFAPERGLAKRLQARFGNLYRAADIAPENFKALEVERVDLSRPSEYFGPESVGGFVHSHVLEHLPASVDQVIIELNEALAPGGFHAFQVPIHRGWYREDVDPAMPAAERVERFYQEDHLRVFGTEDFEERILPLFEGFRRLDLSQLLDDAALMRAAVPPSALRHPTGHSVYLFVKEEGQGRKTRPARDPGAPATMFLPNGERIHFTHPPKLHLPRYLKGRGLQNYEPLTLAAFLAACERSTGAILDVGANIGLFSLSAAAVFRRPVLAFEPYTPAAEVLEAIVRDCGFPVQVSRQALADREGTIPFYLSSRSDMSNSLNPRHRQHAGTVEVPCTSLDRLGERIRISVVKLDTESTETDILRGGSRTLLRDRPLVLLEVLGGAGGAALRDLLAEVDYHLYRFDDPAVVARIGGMRGLETGGDQRNCLAAPAPLDDAFFGLAGDWLARLEALPVPD